MAVDEILQTKVRPEYREVVTMLRGLMREVAPEARELISYGMPAYRMRRIVAVISPTKKDITFSFSRGSQFEDRCGLLKGAGTSSKHVKIQSVDTADRDAPRYYIKQAVEFDAR